MKDLILDLQGNGGGYLNAAIDRKRSFWEAKELIVYTEGSTARRSDFFAKGTNNFKNGRLIILVDEYSLFCQRNRDRSHPGLGQRCDN